jgi:hypothetical protein
MRTTTRIATLAAALSTAAVIVVAPASPSAALNATQQYPYCSISTTHGGISCYVSSLAQCDGDHTCFANPAYVGNLGNARAQGAIAVPQRR